MKSLHPAILSSSLLVLSAGCMLGPLDSMGQETIVTEDEDKSSEQSLKDDRIEDKKPKFDSTLTVTEEFEGCQVTLNKSGSVTKLDIAPFEDHEGELNGALFRGRAEAIKAIKKVNGAHLLPSMEVVNGSMKPFNDGLYAAIEVGVQQGVSGVFPGKQQLLGKLGRSLKAAHAKATATGQAHLERAMIFLGAAIILGGATPEITPSALATAQQNAADFKQQAALYARPVGFYTWNKTLEGIFSQDRYLQNYGGGTSVKEFGLFAALAVVLEQDAALLAQYQKVLALYAGLTNRYASYTPATLFSYVDGLSSLDDVAGIQQKFQAAHKSPYVCSGNYFAFVPASRSKEMDFYKSTYCGGPGPKVDLMNALIKGIREGKVDLTPDKTSGWYEYQLHALETLLLPERGPENHHLLLTAAYKKKLVETFKSIITQTRETHVKQLSVGADSISLPPKEIEIYPSFPVEPFPTFYLRNARAYRFLATFLEGVLGQQFMKSRKRLKETGKASALPLDQELHQMAELLYGLYVLTARSVGLRPESGLLAEELAEFKVADCVKRAEQWARGWQTNADILADPRVIVPIWNNSTNKVIIYWAVLGVKVVKISARFVENYQPKVISSDCKVKGMLPHDYHLLMEQMQEVRIPMEVPPPTRAEFRKICDQHKTRDAIVKALESLKP